MNTDAATGLRWDAWRGAKPALKRALVARYLGTQDSATIDEGVRRMDRATGAVASDPRDTVVLVGVLALLGGAALGAMATLLYQDLSVEEMDSAEYEARVANMEPDFRRHGVRYARVTQVETGAYRARRWV